MRFDYICNNDLSRPDIGNQRSETSYQDVQETMKTNLKILLIGFFLISQTVFSQSPSIPLFPQGAPGDSVSLIEKSDSNGDQVGGKSVLRMTDVSSPEITIYPAQGKSKSDAAMIVCPGGGYNILAYDLEGTEICQWLNHLGITAVLLKYRVPRRKGRAKHEAPLQDAQRAISYVRANAPTLHLNPHKIGIMGFSAGAHLSAMASNHFTQRTYLPFDKTDSLSCRPDFCLLVYPAYLSARNFQLAPEITVTPDTPPTMIVQAEDDRYFINSSLFYYYALKEAGVSATLHLYSKGGHGYGIRHTGASVNRWPERAQDWFREIGIIR